MWFQVQWPPLVGVLPIFRSRYLFAIGHQRVFSLTGWTPQIRTHFHVLSPTQDTSQSPVHSNTGPAPRMACRSSPSRVELVILNVVLQPLGVAGGLGSSAFARRY